MATRRWRHAPIWVAAAASVAACSSTTASSNVTDDAGSAASTAAVVSVATASTVTTGPPASETTVAPPPSSTTLDASTSTTPAPSTSEAAAPTSTPVEPPTTTAPPPPPTPDGCLAELSLDRKIALLVWPSVYSNDWSTARSVVETYQLGGVLLMRPRLDEASLTARIGELDALSRLGLLVATDEEGGDVQRLVDIERFPSQHDVSTTRSPAEAEAMVADHGRLVARVGVDVVLGPVVDVLPADGPPPLQTSRFFAGDAAAVAAFGDAYVRGWQSAGLTPVLKHFPGHGSASADTHDAAAVTPPLDVLVGRDFVPYAALAGSQPAVMVGHLAVPGLTDGVAATLSPAAIGYLRDTLGYGDALLISDSLDMAAAGPSIPAAAVASIGAGIDVAIFTSTNQVGAVIDALRGAVDSGQIPVSRIDDAAARVLRLLGRHGGGCSKQR